MWGLGGGRLGFGDMRELMGGMVWLVENGNGGFF